MNMHSRDDFNVRQRPKRRFWLWRWIFGNPSPPPKRREFGDLPKVDWKYKPQPLEDFVPKKEPVPEPPPASPPSLRQICPVEEAKLQLRRMTWHQFTEAASAMGCDPRKMHSWAMEMA